MSRKSSTPSGFEDCLSLVRRAGVHLKSLHRRLERFGQSGAYRVSAHLDPATVPAGEWALHVGYPPEGPVNAPLVIWRGDALTAQGYIPALPPIPIGPDPREIVITGHVAREPPAEQLGLLVADVVNNLRAALDHAVWHLSAKGHPPPDPVPKIGNGREWRNVAWPITSNDTAWPSTAAMRLRFVEKSVWTEFERLQPWSRRPQQPERDEFAVLDELWNIYKHRHLPLVESWVGLDKVFSTAAQNARRFGVEPAPELAQHTFTILSERKGPFEDGAELGRVREAAADHGFLRLAEPEMNVEAALAVDVAFKEGPAAGEPVESTLNRIRDEVETALETLRPHF